MNYWGHIFIFDICLLTAPPPTQPARSARQIRANVKHEDVTPWRSSLSGVKTGIRVAA